VTGVPGMPLPASHPDLAPCGTLAAYRRHLRRGDPVDRACRQAVNRDREDRAAAGWVRPSRASSVHLAGPGRCYREDVKTTEDPALVTCKHCLGGYRRLPWVAAEGDWYRAA
jgi:hypothetical protein